MESLRLVAGEFNVENRFDGERFTRMEEKFDGFFGMPFYYRLIDQPLNQVCISGIPLLRLNWLYHSGSEFRQVDSIDSEYDNPHYYPIKVVRDTVTRYHGGYPKIVVQSSYTLKKREGG